MKNCYETVCSASTYLLIFASIEAKTLLKFGYWIFSFINVATKADNDTSGFFATYVATLIKTLDAAVLNDQKRET